MPLIQPPEVNFHSQNVPYYNNDTEHNLKRTIAEYYNIYKQKKFPILSNRIANLGFFPPPLQKEKKVK